MSKSNLLEDTFEKLVEQGKTTVKHSVKQAASPFSPTKMWEQILGLDSNPPNPSNPSEFKGKSSESKACADHTPLDIDKLNRSYQKNDQQKAEALRQRLFQLVKSGEEKVLYEKKKEEQEKKQKEMYEIQEKKKKEEEKRRQEQSADIPRGKVRRSIFSHKKVAERSHAETKPSTGKQ